MRSASARIEGGGALSLIRRHAPDIAAAMSGQGFDTVLSTPEQYADKIAADLARWGELARVTGIRIG